MLGCLTSNWKQIMFYYSYFLDGSTPTYSTSVSPRETGLSQEQKSCCFYRHAKDKVLVSCLFLSNSEFSSSSFPVWKLSDFQSHNTMSYFCNWHKSVQEKQLDFEQQAHVIDCQWAVSKHAYSDENLALQTLSIPMLQRIHWSFGMEMKFLSSFDQSCIKSRCFQWCIHNEAKISWVFSLSS